MTHPRRTNDGDDDRRWTQIISSRAERAALTLTSAMTAKRPIDSWNM